LRDSVTRKQQSGRIVVPTMAPLGIYSAGCRAPPGQGRVSPGHPDRICSNAREITSREVEASQYAYAVPSQARGDFNDNYADIARLIEIHKELAGTGPGYKHGVAVLNKSAVVLTSAVWEAFCEDLSRPRFTGRFCGERGDHAMSA
jgi:hypothetical protein